MGGGSYDPIASRSRSTTYYQHKTREEVFSQRNMDPLMNPKGVTVREALVTLKNILNHFQ